MSPKLLRDFCQLDLNALNLLKTAMKNLGLSARAYDRILNAVLTIADLAGKENITSAHIAEAIQYRSLDREGWMKS